VVGQLAVSLVLLNGAGLLLASLGRLEGVDPGYRTEDVLVMSANYEAPSEADRQRALLFFEELARQGASLPGIESVSLADSLPVDDLGSAGAYQIKNRPLSASEASAKQRAIWRAVGANYFGTLGVRVVAGRDFDQRDAGGAPPVVIINESMAKAGWPGRDPIGDQIGIGWDGTTKDLMTIVGVVADTAQGTLDAPIGQELFVPVAQHPKLAPFLKVVARTSGPPLAQSESFRQLASRLNAEVPVKFTTAELLVSRTFAAPRFRALLIGLFAAAALLLALVGTAAVMAYVVAERRREIGIRMALGAPSSAVVRRYLFWALRLALGGTAIGVVIALVGARLVRGLLYGVSATDPLILATVSFVLVTASVLAAAWPARRAATVSPTIALRAE
jgi:predicted permease